MKKKGLLITLISTIVVVAIIGGLSIGKLFSSPDNPANPGNQVSNKVSNDGNNKGSKDDPYYIYDTDTFTTLISTYGNQTKPYRETVMDPVMIEVVNENGETETVQKKDENGNLVFEPRKDENGYVVYKTIEGMLEPYHFELKNDIDFSGVDFKILFNNNNAFTGVLDGKGYTVKNISINITKENLEKNMFTKGDATKSYAHIGIFGDMKGAIVKDINFDAINIDVANEVYTYLQEPEFWDKYHTSLVELSIGSLAACVENTTVVANVNAVINADSYSVYEENKNQGRNCVGGLIGYTINSTVSSYNNNLSSIKIISDSGSKNYYIGGAVGYMFDSEICNLKISSEITASAAVKSQKVSNKLWIGGVAGYMLNSTVKDSIVSLDVKQLVDEERIVGSGVMKIDNGLYNMIGGIVSVIRVDSNEQLSTISNVRVSSNVDMDALFGGALFEVKLDISKVLTAQNKIIAIKSVLTDEEKAEFELKVQEAGDDASKLQELLNGYTFGKDANGKITITFNGNAKTVSDATVETIEKNMTNNKVTFVKLEDLVIKSNVNTLMAYGLASKLLFTDISYTENFVCGKENNSIGEATDYNIYLSGKTILSTQRDESKNYSIVASGFVCTNTGDYSVYVNYGDLKIMISYEHYTQLSESDALRKNLLGGFSYTNTAK